MRISWFLGFGWPSVLVLLASGLAVNLLGGWLRWVFYLPFIVAGIYMTVRFRIHSSQPWRRIHARVMLEYAKLAEAEFEAAKREGRSFDPGRPCRALAERSFGAKVDDNLASVLGEGRKAYYRSLVEAQPEIFVEGAAREKREALLRGAKRDIESSELGPDAVVARLVEARGGQAEAARYLRALLSGQVR